VPGPTALKGDKPKRENKLDSITNQGQSKNFGRAKTNPLPLTYPVGWLV